MEKISSLFYQGLYKSVLERIWDVPVRKDTPADVPYLVGSLAFTGRIEEAELLLEKSLQAAMRPDGVKGEKFKEEWMEARFYLSVNLCRIHRFEKAKRYLTLNLRDRRRRLSPKARFFLFQGLAFHRYIGCRPMIALKWGRLASAAAGEANFTYGRLLAEDLVSHCLVQSGQIQQGLMNFERACDLAEKAKSTKLVQTFRLSKIIYCAQFLLMPIDAIKSLEMADQTLSPDNIFAKTSLRLEIANQKIWLGRLDEAQRDLDRASELIYGTAHARNRILLNLRYAFLSALRGQKQFALSQLASVAAQLDSSMDLTLNEALVSIEIFVLRSLPSPNENRLRELTSNRQKLRHKTAGSLGHRFFPHVLIDGFGASSPSTDGGSHKAGVEVGAEISAELGPKISAEDYHGNLVDRALHAGAASAAELLNAGIAIWAPSLFGAETQGKGILVDLIPGAMMVVDHGQVEFVERGVTPVLRNVLRCLANSNSLVSRADRELGQSSSHVSREVLFKSVWGFEYDPLRHSGLLYQAFSRLRQLLGARAHWVEHDENGYQLISDLQYLCFITSARLNESLVTGGIDGLESNEMNWRQIEILKAAGVANGGSTDVADGSANGSANRAMNGSVGGSRNGSGNGSVDGSGNGDTIYIDVRWCMNKFKISDMTARRDLVGLVKLGKLSRCGQARATKYRSAAKAFARGINERASVEDSNEYLKDVLDEDSGEGLSHV